MRPAHYESTAVRVDKVVVGPYENNAYVVRCKQTGEAVLVDAANEHELLVPLCQALGVRRVLTTHGHFDHIQAVEACREAGLDVGVAAEDAKMLPSYDFVIGDEDVISVGDLRLRAIHTPGHTPGSVCLQAIDEGLLYSGDTLFAGGWGRVDLPGGSAEAIVESLARLAELESITAVYPGHGPATTIGRERPWLEMVRSGRRLPA